MNEWMDGLKGRWRGMMDWWNEWMEGLKRLDDAGDESNGGMYERMSGWFWWKSEEMIDEQIDG